MLINKKIITSAAGFLMVALLSVGKPGSCYAQVYGCTDPFANNYNPSATGNNGSCTYNVINYTPTVKVNPISDSLTESSGLQMAGNFLWTFNDGGGAAAIYRIDTLTKILLQKVSLSGAQNIDWEDISFDGLNFYIGDFGNNANGARTDLKIYKFPFSAIPDYVNNPVASIPVAVIETINFSYGNQPQPPQSSPNNQTKFDCEAMIVDSGKIHLFSKNWIELTTTHYEINSLEAGTYIADSLETLVTNYLVTAADKAPGKKLVALLGYKASGFGNHYMHLLSNYTDGKYFNGNKRELDLPNAGVMGQAEGLCFRTGSYGYLSNERFQSFISQKLFSFDISNFIAAITTYTFAGNGNWDLPANWSNNTVPPASVGAGNEIVIDPIAGGTCILNIPYTVSAGAKLMVNNQKNFVIMGNLTLQ